MWCVSPVREITLFCPEECADFQRSHVLREVTSLPGVDQTTSESCCVRSVDLTGC